MDKKIVLRDYTDDRKEFIIPDFENVESIEITILSGDEIADITYKDGKEISFDSSDDRIIAYNDDYYELPLEFIDEFSNFEGSSYRCSDYIARLKE